MNVFCICVGVLGRCVCACLSGMYGGMCDLCVRVFVCVCVCLMCVWDRCVYVMCMSLVCVWSMGCGMYVGCVCVYVCM